MVVANLLYRPIRTLISVLAIAFEVTLILVIVGLSLGIIEDSRTRQAGIGADLMVRPPGSSFLSGVTGAPVSVKVADKIAALPHVRTVAPVITQINTAGAVEILYGIDERYQRLGNPFRYIAGNWFERPYDILVDDFFAASQNIKVNDSVEVLNHRFRVVGIVENGKGARKFLPIATLQGMIGAEGKASIFYVEVDDPKNFGDVAAGIRAIPGMQQYNIQSLKEWLSLMTPSSVPGFSTFINVVIGVAVTIGFIVIFQSMYTAVMERTREIGILKSLGASKTYIMRVILRETALLAVTGIVVGIGISYLAREGILNRFPTLRVIIPRDWILYTTIIAFIGALLGAIYPAIKAAQKDPIDALAYE